MGFVELGVEVSESFRKLQKVSESFKKGKLAGVIASRGVFLNSQAWLARAKAGSYSTDDNDHEGDEDDGDEDDDNNEEELEDENDKNAIFLNFQRKPSLATTAVTQAELIG